MHDESTIQWSVDSRCMDDDLDDDDDDDDDLDVDNHSLAYLFRMMEALVLIRLIMQRYSQRRMSDYWS